MFTCIIILIYSDPYHMNHSFVIFITCTHVWISYHFEITAFLRIVFFPKSMSYNEHYNKYEPIYSTDFSAVLYLDKLLNIEHLLYHWRNNDSSNVWQKYECIYLSPLTISCSIKVFFGQKLPLSFSAQNKFDTYERIHQCVSCEFEMIRQFIFWFWLDNYLYDLNCIWLVFDRC